MQIQTGDRFLIQGDIKKQVLPRGIHHFMKLYGEKFGLKADWLCTHAGSLVNEDGKIWVYEAVATGYKKNNFEKHYGKKGNYVIMRKNDITPSQQWAYWVNADKYTSRFKPYQYWNFIQWILFIYSQGNIDLFGPGSAKALYCFEGEARNSNAMEYGHYPWPEITTSYDLYNDNKYSVIIDKR